MTAFKIFIICMILVGFATNAIRLKAKTEWELGSAKSTLQEGKTYVIRNMAFTGDFISIDVFSKKIVYDWVGSPIKLKKVTGTQNQWYMNIDSNYWVKDMVNSGYCSGWKYSSMTNLRWKIHKPYGSDTKFCIQNMSTGRVMRATGDTDIIQLGSSCTSSKNSNEKKK
mmetsp:Transcript_112589/g.157911  ORF Transcript_112589/g.157911 Transcript_112589/m.157911 type:complete len:168 (+) Transcript_112589:39-542(+)